MKNIIGLYVGNLYFPREKMHTWDEENLSKGGIGGSEIWAIEIASKFESNGYHVMLFCDCDNWHYSYDGVEYIPMGKFNDVCEYTEFKYFITSRRVDELNDKIKAERIYLMLHDPFVLFDDTFNEFVYDKIYKITYQSDFQKRLLKERYPFISDDKLFKTIQAIDFNLYEGEAKKKNKMVWSTHKIRGARLLIEKIFPMIRKEIPDFEIDVCGYVDDITDDYFFTEGVNIKGNVTKDELIRLQKESKIWIYPNYGKFEDGRINDETFCITAIENAAANNALVLSDRTCFSTTLNGYDGFVGTELFGGNDIIDENKIDEFCNLLSRQAIQLLKDNEYRTYLSNQAYNLCKKYTWDEAVNTFINDFETKETLNNGYGFNIILLTGAYRIYNMDKIFNSIKKELGSKDNIYITWLICHDTNNSIGDASKIVESCKEYAKENGRFGWCYYPIYGDTKAKYGGALFNEALQYVRNEYYPNTNPWVYILDDDNIINPLMAESITDAIMTAESKGKNIIYYNIMYENGICAPLCHTSFVPKVSRSGDFIPYYLVPDPSQLVIKYDAIEDMGFYRDYLRYDEDIFIYMENNFDKICFPEEWDKLGRQYLDKYQTYHNAINDKDEIEKWLRIIDDNSKNKSIVLSICTNDDSNKMFVINNNVYAKQLLNDLKNE